MLLYSNLKTISARAGFVAIAVLAASVASANTYQFPLTTTVGLDTVLNFNRTSIDATNFAQIQTGQTHSIARTSGGAVYTWGEGNTSGQMGRTGSLDVPTQVTSFQDTTGAGVATPNVIDIAAGDTFSVALDSAGNVYYTGAISGQTSRTIFRQIANPGSPAPFLGKDVTAGGGHIICVFFKTAGSKFNVYAIGNNSDGQCAVAPATNPVTTWTQIAQVSDKSVQTKAIAAGSLHSLVIENDGRVWAFGDNASGQLANGTLVDSSTPVNCKDSAGTVISTTGANVSAGFDSSLLLTTTNTVLSAGGNSNGQLGRTSGSASNFITVGLSNITSVSTGYKHAFAVDNTGNLYRWGFMVRTGDVAESVATPTLTPGFSGITVVHAGRRVINTGAVAWDNLLNTTGGYNAIVATGTTPLFKRKDMIDGSDNVVVYLTGGMAGGKVRIELDSAPASNMTINVASDSAELTFNAASGTVLAGETTCDIPITTTSVASRTTTTFTMTQTAGWVLPGRKVLLRAPAATVIAVANDNIALAQVKGGTATATVTLNAPAPAAGGYTLTLNSNTPGVIGNVV
ncbi:MAG TPA: hypothetical protein VK934_02730, partial [Fimbriimonas sp.]|nr:hypothetical protein [Fimbriimonas sp.]